MLFWVLGFFILLIVAMVPILSIVLDSPAIRRILEARQDTSKMDALVTRVQTLEDEMATLERGVEGIREENKFLQRMLENPERPRPPKG
jgi:outer membrane murein-binding lipoprotein Lpp